MTTMFREESCCAVCGNINEFSVIGSTNTFGSMDLDTRPPEMKRSTMNTWVQECPTCGYVSSRIENSTGIEREYLKSVEYLSCDGINFSSDLAKKFYKQSLIALKENEPETAYFALLHSAWACDDADDNENATICRNLCIDLIPDFINDENKNNLLVMKADFLRRTCAFEKLLNEYSNVKMEDSLLQSILDFQIKKAIEKDTSVYKVSDALE